MRTKKPILDGRFICSIMILSFVGMLAWIPPTLAQDNGKRGVLSTYADPKELTDLSFGSYSHWLQPWRAYLETLPATKMTQSAGINLNLLEHPEWADAVCRQLEDCGFRYARIEVSWGAFRYDQPDQLINPSIYEKLLTACSKHHIRPLLLLNANHGQPCPLISFNLKLTEAAKQGDRTIKVDPATIKGAVVGRTGLSNLSFRLAAEAIFTKIDTDGTVTLSKPLPKALEAGEHPASTLLYPPFAPAPAAGQAPSDSYQQTMAGWLKYVGAVGAFARKTLGTSDKKDAGFDLEIWNELSFGSNFLNINSYYNPPILQGAFPDNQIVLETIRYVRTTKGFSGVGLTDGFENQRPWASGETLPAGLTAISKHPYGGRRVIRKTEERADNLLTRNALGQTDSHRGANNRWQDNWSPSYVAYFPEIFLSGLKTETIIRDIAPIRTNTNRTVHGRDTSPRKSDGSHTDPLDLWVTEVNMDPKGADPGALKDAGRTAAKNETGLTTAQVERLRAKSVLRYLSSFVNKGVDRIYFFAAFDEDPLGFGILSRNFYEELKKNPSAYPGNTPPAASEAMVAIRRLMDKMHSSGSIGSIRPVTLQQVEEPVSHVQFEGDPATANQNPNPHPPLYNRDVLAFLPFQTGSRKYAIPLYVMTRNLAQDYHPGAPAGDVSRFDMPEEEFILTIRGIRNRESLSLYDPITDKSEDVKVISSSGNSLKIQVMLTDSPRLLIVR